MPTRSLIRRLGRGLAAGVLATVGVATATAGAASEPADTTAYTGELTFDWPLDCPAGVSQQYLDAAMVVDVAYDVELAETDTGIEARFGPAMVVDAVVDRVDDASGLGAMLGAFFTTPTLDVALDGGDAEPSGFRGWLGDFRAVGPSEEEAATAGLQREVDFRSSAVIWQTWVGLWASLGEVSDLRTELDGVGYVDELGDQRSAPLVVESRPRDGVAGGAVLHAARELSGSELESLFHHGVEPVTLAAVEYDPDADQRRVTTFAVTADPATLQPAEAMYEVVFDDGTGADLVVAFEWTFDWADCDGGRSVADVAADAVADVAGDGALAPPREPPGEQPDDHPDHAPRPGGTVPAGMATITVDELPDEAIDTLLLIEIGGPFPYRQDDTIFENREGLLPDRPYGHYREYTVDTPGSPDRGARRIVTGADGEIYYTDDHYSSFVMVLLPTAAFPGHAGGADAAHASGRSLCSRQDRASEEVPR